MEQLATVREIDVDAEFAGLDLDVLLAAHPGQGGAPMLGPTYLEGRR